MALTDFATNHLTYPGDVTDAVAVGDMLGADSTGYPYRVTETIALAGPRTATTYVGLEPWPADDWPGLERVIEARRAATVELNRFRALFAPAVA